MILLITSYNVSLRIEFGVNVIKVHVKEYQIFKERHKIPALLAQG